MKTGRRRKKEARPEKKSTSPPPSPKASSGPTSFAPPRPSSSSPAAIRPKVTPFILFGTLFLLVVCIAITLSLLVRKGEPATYLPATAEGQWTANVKLLVPQLISGQSWRSDCDANPACSVLASTCQTQQRKDRFTEQTVDDYDDFAYDIYYEEAEQKLYEATDAGFDITTLNEDKDWVEGDRHYFSEEWLDKETCEYTEYAVWITDPQDDEYEVEVVLSECQIWDHVIVKQRIYEEGEFCQTETVGSLTVQDTLTQQGVGANIHWPNAVPPEDGKVDQEFEGVVIFRADGTVHRVKVNDPNAYIRYLTIPHYLGVNEEGKVISLTDRTPSE